MRLLILGGTVFLGRHVAEIADRRGHQITLFNRGRSAPAPVADVEQIHGDRATDLGRLGERRWEAVIDTSGYLPGVVAAAAERLADRVEHYTFVSSISAYADLSEPGLDEHAPLAALPDPPSEDVGEFYGPLKAACEREVARVHAGRCAIVRPGLIVGPHDPTERFTYWVRRMGEGGRVLVPHAPHQPVQFIDVRDLAGWLVALAERRTAGTFNATGPVGQLTFKEMLERIDIATGGRGELGWVAEEHLAAAGVEPWQDLPLWLDLPRHRDLTGFLAVSTARALTAGLTLRPLEDTVADTLAWVASRRAIPNRGAPIALPNAGLTLEREAELLDRLPRRRVPS